jgi:hypothetical protein
MLLLNYNQNSYSKKKNWQEIFGLGSLLPGRKTFYQGLLPLSTIKGLKITGSK